MAIKISTNARELLNRTAPPPPVQSVAHTVSEPKPRPVPALVVPPNNINVPPILFALRGFTAAKKPLRIVNTKSGTSYRVVSVEEARGGQLSFTAEDESGDLVKGYRFNVRYVPSIEALYRAEWTDIASLGF